MLDYHVKQSKKLMKKGMGVARMAALSIFCMLAFVLLLYLAIAWYRSKAGHEDYIVFLPMQEEGNSHLIVQEIICPKGAELCFKVEDYRLSSRSKLSARYERRMMVETVDEVVLSVAELVPNPGEPFTPEKAKNWSVLKTRLILPYAQGIIGQMFATGCIQLDSSRKMRTLMVGLGGAGIPNFLGELEGNHEIVSIELEPAVEYIAHKWFGLEKSAKQKVIIQDGLEFINNWYPNSGHFDCIIIDACTNTMETGSKSAGKYPLICPIPDFVNNEQILKKMFAMLTAKGTLLINTFAVENESNKEEVAEERQFLLELFRHHFGHCYYADVVHNKILVCSLALNKSEPMTNGKYEEAMGKLPSWLQNELNTRVTIIDELWRPGQRTEI